MPAEPYGMGRGVRTSIFVIAVAVMAAVVPPSASEAAGLGDLLGIISGGPGPPQQGQGGPQSPPPQPAPPQPPRPHPQDRPVPPGPQLLAPEPSCPGQNDPKLP